MRRKDSRLNKKKKSERKQKTKGKRHPEN